jgi:predicted ATPase
MIAEITLRNFKCFDELDLKLGPLTLLSGTNSAGKSSVLQSILLLRQSALHDQLKSGGRAVLNGELVHLGNADATLREGASGSPLDIAVTWTDGAKAGWRLAAEPKGEGLIVVVAPDDDAWKERAPIKRSRYVSADRIGPRVAYPTSDALVLASRDLGARGEFVAHYLAAHGEERIPNESLHFDGISFGGTEPAASFKLRHEVEAWLGLLVPGVRIIVEQPRGLDVIRLAYQFPGEVGLTDERRPTHVGFGLSYVLPIFVAVLAAEPGSLVMLENPEAHLHPRAQRLIVELLARAAAAGVQVLVETHSDHVLNGARLAVRKGTLTSEQAVLHFFTHDPKTGRPGRISPSIQKSGALTDWPPGFFDEWDRALDELLA